MRSLPFAVFTVAQLLGSACTGPDATAMRLDLQGPAADLILGSVPQPGFTGVPGSHYCLWVQRADGEQVLVVRFVAVQPPLELLEADAVVSPDALQVRLHPRGELTGYAATQCFNGPCGGAIFRSGEYLDDAVMAWISRETDGTTPDGPTDVMIRGPVQPYGRGTIRGTLKAPGGEALPSADLLLVPGQDGALL